MSSKPFIIYRNRTPLIPENHQQFDENREKMIRFVQGANLYIVFGIGFETLRAFYYHSAYKDQCEDYSQLLFLVMIANVIWILVSMFSTYGINQVNSKMLKYNIGLLVFVGLSRVAMGVGIHHTMVSVVKDNYYCNYVYQPGLNVLQSGVESTLILIMLFFCYKIHGYVRSTVLLILKGLRIIRITSRRWSTYFDNMDLYYQQVYI